MRSKRKAISTILIFSLLMVLFLVGPAMAETPIMIPVNGVPVQGLDETLDSTVGSVGSLVGSVGGTVGDLTGFLGGTLNGLTDSLATGGLLGPVLDNTGDVLNNVVGGVVGGTVDNLVTSVGEVLVTHTYITFTIGDPYYYINGTQAVMDVAPYIRHNRAYLPARYVGNSLNVLPTDIDWDPRARTATLSKGGTTISLTDGSNVMYVNGNEVPIDAPIEIAYPGRVMLPYRWVAEALGANVAWQHNTKTVVIEYH